MTKCAHIASMSHVKIASMPCENRKYAMYESQVCHVQIASMPCTNRKYAMYKSQVFHVQIASMSGVYISMYMCKESKEQCGREE